MKRFVFLISSLLILLMTLTQIPIKPVTSGILDNVKHLTSVISKLELYDIKALTGLYHPLSPSQRTTEPAIVQNNNQNGITDGEVLPIGSIIKGQQVILASYTQSNDFKLVPPSLLNSDVQHEVSITVTGAQQIQLSDPLTLSGLLLDLTTNSGIANKSIKFYTNDTLLGQTHTNDDGTYQININKNLPAGKYQVTALFNGAHLLPADSASMSLVILPATVQVQTVPAIEGIKFVMDGHTFTSGKDGMARVQIDQIGEYRLDVLVDQYSNPSEQVQFGRWTAETYQPYRMVQVPDNHVIQVGLNVFHKVGLKFVDLSGFPVNPSRVTSISIRSIQGDVFTLKPGDTPWLPAIRTARRQTGLEETNLLYSIDSVTIDGSNVVNAAQQRFYANTDDTWQISLLLYSMHITIKDALLRSPVGTSVDVLLPNGQIDNYPLDASGVLDLHSLARGIYRVTLVGASGLGTSTPVALSRDQVVNLKILTKLDLMLFMSVSSTFAMGLIFYGRPWLLKIFSKKSHHSFNRMSKDFGA